MVRDKRQAPDHKTTEVHICGISYNTSFAHTLGYTEGSYTVSNFSVYYTVHCIKTVLLNYTISVKIGIDVVT